VGRGERKGGGGKRERDDGRRQFPEKRGKKGNEKPETCCLSMFFGKKKNKKGKRKKRKKRREGVDSLHGTGREKRGSPKKALLRGGKRSFPIFTRRTPSFFKGRGKKGKSLPPTNHIARGKKR